MIQFDLRLNLFKFCGIINNNKDGQPVYLVGIGENMAPKVSEQYLEDRRNQILDAAVASFSRNGFHQTTIEDIRLEAGLSRGAVYHYFKTKEDIIDAIRRRSARQAETIIFSSAETDDAESALLSLIDSTVSNMVSPTSIDANRLAMFLWAESLVNKRIMDGQLPAFQPYLATLAESVSKSQAAGKVDPGLDPQAIARLIMGAMLGLQLQLCWEPDIDLDASRDVLASMLTGRYRQTPLRT